MNKILTSILIIISIFSISAYIFQLCINQWLNYFQWNEITYWQSFSLFVLFGMGMYFYKSLKDYIQK
jgi:hypothetical protein